VLAPRRHHDLWGPDLLGVRPQQPAAVGPLDPADTRREPHVDRCAGGVALEVLHHLIPRREHGGAPWEAPAREMRQRAARVEAQPVVAGTPRGADLTRLVQHERPDPGGLQREGDGQAGRPGTHDGGLALAHGTLLFASDPIPDGAVFARRRPLDD
jgi:hypothetical protein